MRIIQVLDALDYGDGVSNDVINKNDLFTELGYDSLIYSKWANKKVDKFRQDIDLLSTQQDDILLHHFSGKSHILDKVLSEKCTKILVYHNITPSHFFNGNKNQHDLDEGEEQLKDIFENYNHFLADSEFNVECLRRIGINDEIDVIPILVDFSEIDRYKKTNFMLNKNRELNFLFVGRVAPNKKHEDIISIFDYYYNNINCNTKLIFVGNFADYMDYYNELQSKISVLRSSNNIIFTGKVDTNDLYDYYLNSNVFICMSEHEGFCIPLLESMYCGLPTLAYNAGAIKTTMGDAGILINYKSPETIARLIYTITASEDIKSQITKKQNMWVQNFTKEIITEKIDFLIKRWTGEKCYE